MARQSETDREIAYPQLDKAAIDAVIDALMHSLRDRDLAAQAGTFELTLSYLIGFRTRRWGLPPALAGHRGPATSLAAGTRNSR